MAWRLMLPSARCKFMQNIAINLLLWSVLLPYPAPSIASGHPPWCSLQSRILASGKQWSRGQVLSIELPIKAPLHICLNPWPYPTMVMMMVMMVLRVLGLGSGGQVLSIELPMYAPWHICLNLWPYPTMIMMLRVLGLGSRGQVLSIEYWVAHLGPLAYLPEPLTLPNHDYDA